MITSIRKSPLFLSLFVLITSTFFVQCDLNGVKEAEVTTDEFLETIAGDKLTFVDFYTTWCGPCKAMDPHVKKVKSNRNDINVIQVDAEAQMSIAGRYNIRAYPTIILFKNGEVLFRGEGGMNEEQILALVDRYK